MSDGCRNRVAGRRTRVVRTQIFAAGTVRFVPAQRGSHESGVLTGGGGDEDFVIGLAPI